MSPPRAIGLAPIVGLVALAWPASADTILVDDDLTSAAGCTTTCAARSHVGSDGLFKVDGWHQGGPNARVIYDLGQSVECGALDFTITNFDPTIQVAPNGGTDEYHVLMRLNEDPAGQRLGHPSNTILDPSAVHIQVVRFDGQSLERHKRFRLSTWNAGGWSGDNRYTGKFGSWNLNHVYAVHVEWDSTGSRVAVTNMNTNATRQVDVPVSWPPGETDPSLNLRHLFLGRDNCNHCGQTMTGPVWSNVRVTAFSACPAGLVCDCVPDELAEQSCGECGTQSRACGSGCLWAGDWS
jgi:hypothetical protein